MKIKIFLLVLTVWFVGVSEGIANIRKANRYFELFKYSKAIPLYIKLAETGNESTRREATFRLADCYRLVNDVKEARSWYAKAVDMYNPEPVQYFYLGQALRTLEQYDEAEKAFLRYATLMPNDPRGETYARYCREIQSLGSLPESVEIKNAAHLNTRFYDFGPVFYKEGMVFTSDRKEGLADDNIYEWTNYGFLNLYESSPTFYRDFWTEMSKPVKMSGLFNQKYHDGPVSFSADFKTIFLTRTLRNKVKRDRNRINTNLLQIFYADIRYSGKIDFISLPHNNENYSVAHPTVSNDGKRLIFSSDMPGGFGGSDLYITEREGSKWSDPVNLGAEINSFGSEVFPFWYNDTTLYFSSDSHLGYGGLDVFVSKLVDGKWTTPQNLLKPINSPYDDFGLVFHFEKKDGFFSSNRPGGMGADDIYAIRNYTHKTGKPKPEEKQVPVESIVLRNLVCGYVKDKQTLLPIENASVFMLNSAAGEFLVLKTDVNGYYEAAVEPNILYVAKAMMANYFDDCINFRFLTLDADKCNPAPRDLLLDKYSLNQVFRIDNIYYDLDKWLIRPDARPPLNNIVRIMNQYPINIELSSHTDCRASHEYNQRLSQRRAEAAVEYIVSNGINPARLVARGYGETMLVNHCADGVPCSEAEHQANRRTEFKITSVNSQFVEKKSFDPTVFKAGDKIPVQLLDANFFSECLLTQVDRTEVPGNERIAPVHSTAPSTPKAPEPKVQTAGMVSATQPISQPRIEPAPNLPVRQPETTNAVVDIQAQNNSSFFTVQLKAATKPVEINSRNFPGLENVFVKKIGIYYKYFTGTYNSLNEASTQRNLLNSQFPGCFVVAFKDGEVVTINELREYLR